MTATGWIGTFALAAIFCLGSCPPDPGQVASSDLKNPGRGWTTHSSLAGEAKNAGYPLSAIAYYRFTWKQAEPAEGAYAFATLDDIIARAKAAGQRFAFRIMADSCAGGPGVPDWLKPSITGWDYAGDDGSACFAPDPSDATFLAHAQALIAAFGARYDGNPDIDHADIGLVGDYGEWHISHAEAVAAGAAMPSLPVRKQYIDWYFAAFPSTQLIMLIGDPVPTDPDADDALAYALGKGAGWRADCWGDYRSPTNHMEDDYPAKLAATSGMAEAWRTAPVALETCGIPADWYANWPARLDDILDFAVDVHASVLNAKSSALPAAWAARLSEFGSRIGYRFILAGSTVPATAAAGSSLAATFTWRNDGNAPIYRPYKFAARLVSEGAEIARVVSTEDLRKWMPWSADAATYTVPLSLAVPAGATGNAILQVSMLDPATGLPAIRFPMDGGRDDLWYDAGTVALQ